MLIATFVLEYPILREALSAAPGLTLTWIQSDRTEAGEHKLLVWADGDERDFEAFEDGLERDPTVEPPLRIVEIDGRRLYQLELTAEGKDASVYPIVIDDGVVLEHVTASHGGWELRVAFPDEESLERFHRFCTERGMLGELRHLYEKREPDGGRQFGLTDRQRETLVAAVETGYLDVPRSCTLAELGERLDVSANATSERFRRGVRTLIEHTVYPDPEAL